MKFISIFAALLLLLGSCNPGKKLAGEPSAAAQQYDLKLGDSLRKKFNSGTDFFASGIEPASWELDMDFDKNFSFSASDGVNISTYAVKGAAVENETIYDTETKAGKLSIHIFKETCSNGSREKKVTVSIAGKTYTGCGKYLYNNLLNDTWVLQKIGSQVLNEKMFSKGLPRMQFDLSAGNTSGHNGCNSFGGNISVEGSRIRFGPLMQTEMFCSGNDPVAEKIIGEKISGQAASYYFQNGRLYLYLSDDNLLEFTKAVN
ncbi:MAG: META domain-containing protein [Ferruginibacter sp.]